MSDNPNVKNNPDKRRSARSRLRAEQLRRRRTRARRRKVAIAAALTAVLLGGGVAIAIGTASSGSARGPLTVPANTSGTDGTVIVYGSANARNTLEVWEDFRCPYCRKLENTDGQVIQHLADTGRYKIRYHMGTFLDGNLGGHGSMNALQAAGAALNESPAKFKAFHDVLYANQPDERTDAFGDNDHLLALAAKVPGLNTPHFVNAVRNGTYATWARKVSDAFTDSDVNSTPTLKLNGRELPVLDGNGNPVTPAQYTALIDSVSALKGPAS
jgi:protein-disulfide isomerase